MFWTLKDEIMVDFNYCLMYGPFVGILSEILVILIEINFPLYEFNILMFFTDMIVAFFCAMVQMSSYRVWMKSSTFNHQTFHGTLLQN